MAAEIKKNDLFMKRFLTICIAAFIYANTYGQNICAGKIIYTSDPTEPYSGAVFSLETGSNYYILSINSHWISCDEELIVEDVEYFLDDKVVITGTTSIRQCVNSKGYWEEYLELEIETIEKLSPGRNIQQYFGTFEIYRDCGVDSWRTGDVIWKIYAAYPNDSFDIRGGVGLLSILNNNSFVIERWEYSTSGSYFNMYTVGEGYMKNDSVFVNYTQYNRDHTTPFFSFFSSRECHCKGKKIASSGIAPTSVSDKNKVYYDVTKQVIVIDATLQNQSFTFELINMQGKVVCSKTIAGNSFIDVANLPKGIYLYRLLQNNGAIYSGKIMLK